MMILYYCRINVGFFLKIKSYLDTGEQRKKQEDIYFSNPRKSYFNDPKNQMIFNIFCRCFDSLRIFPTKYTILALIEKTGKDEEINLLLKSIIEKIYEDLDIDPEYIEKETENFIKEAKSYEAILLAQSDIEKRNYGNMVSRIEEAARISFNKDFGLSIKDVDESLRRIKVIDDEEKIPTGFKAFDSIIDGGLHPKEMIVISGIPGSYKTGFLGNIALNCSLGEGKKSLVFTFETSSERLSMRYFQNIANMNKSEILLNEEAMKQKVEETFSETDGDIVIKEYNSNEVCSNDLMAYIDDLWMYKKWKPDIVFVDYLLIMRTNDRTLSTSDSYRYFKTVAEEVRNIAKTLFIPVVTACQINREGQSEMGGSKAMVTAKNISESRGIYDTADVFITIIQTASDYKKKNIYLNIAKNRSERTGDRILFEVNYDHHKLKEIGII